MAGHSQFKNIMHKKGKQDAIRSKLFAKLAREITVAAKMGLPDPGMNARLRAAVLAARAENMPKDNIERAIKKASGAEGENYDEVRYEGYAPGGVAIIIEALTDNRNRTAGEVRSYFTKAGGALAEAQKALEAKFGEPRKASLVWRPQNAVPVDDEAGEKILRLIGALEDNDDVQNVTANFEISDALMAKMQG